MTRRHGRKRKRVSMHGLQGDERRAEDRERGGMLKGCSWQLYPDGREQDEDREEGKRTKGSHTENAKKAVHRCISALFRCVCVCVCVRARARLHLFNASAGKERPTIPHARLTRPPHALLALFVLFKVQMRPCKNRNACWLSDTQC